MIHIKRIQEDGADVIILIGEIDASSSIELDLAIAKSVGEGYSKILIDCSALDYISSAGLGVFMSYIEEFKDRNVKMVLFGMNDKVANTFSILGLNELLKIGKDKVEAKEMAS
ncbi:STAS domain-containing protein [Pseudochryseolinea flava]|uniref:Anti-sigma factor antagonist n=1 Tax=Pseudochryseolinea flava TaxID=2059302 RepID=A0A364YAR1_9BACT|nr:STAS domain-containing protein [Pseudochryseolinea flava]RAW03455.1 anti-sigma factor antagonist [Pseudochryseolinea flava]